MFDSVDPTPDFAKMEEKLLLYWERNKIFEKSLEKTESGKPYTFYDGPPFATGLPHYGHILASTIKDLIPRYQTMQHRFVRRRWGWDCHGLPIEELVERELGISGKKDIEEKVGIEKFNATCRKYVLRYAEEWGKMVRRIARWIEFDNAYKTMDTDYMESVWWAFKQIYSQGLIYEGRKVLLYCPRCETPVSNFEVAMDNSYQTVTDEAVIVKFKVQNPEAYHLEPNTYLLAWTTTPWTLPGNLALAVGEDIDYAVVESEGEYYIVAKELAEKILDTKYQILDTVYGSELVGLEYEPLFAIAAFKSDKSYKVYEADFVITDEGTGIVHTAVVYGEDDYDLGQRVGLPVVPLLTDQGRFNETAPELLQGLDFKESEKKIIADLEKRGLLFSKEEFVHPYPHCWRCERPLFYNAIPAWFINIAKIKDQILKSNDKEMEWYPAHLKHGRYENSVTDAPDWNISRNRFWGNPMPIWRCTACEKDTVVGSIEELEKKATSGFEALVREGGIDLHRPYIDEVRLECAHCGGDAERISEIFDSWVEASSMPFGEFHYPFENKEVFEDRYPAQFVAEYIAQTRAWFYTMHVLNLILFGQAPFENVVTTGTILAEDGSKMSKSKRNFPDPWEVIGKYGVDSLRFYLMRSVAMQAGNLNFSEKDLQIVNRKVFRILWNVYNFFVTYANDAGWTFDPEQSPQATKNSKNILDRWQNARSQELIGKVTEYLDNYDTVKATREIEQFVNDLSTWYIRRSRGRSDDAFFATLFRSLIYLCKVLAPIAPYMSEAIYQNLNHPDYAESVHLNDWPVAKKDEVNTELLEQMRGLRGVVEQAHALRAEAGIKLRQPLASLTVPDAEGQISDDLLEIAKDEVNVKEIKFGDKLELDTTLTDKLRIEGKAAEIQRQINNFRKESGLQIGERADLYYETDSEVIKKSFALVDKEKIYADKISDSSSMDKPDFETEIEIDGDSFKLYLAS